MSDIQKIVMIVWLSFGCLLLAAWVNEQFAEIGATSVAYAR